MNLTLVKLPEAFHLERIRLYHLFCFLLIAPEEGLEGFKLHVTPVVISLALLIFMSLVVSSAEMM